MEYKNGRCGIAGKKVYGGGLMTGIIDWLSWPVHQGSCPCPGLRDGLGWTGVNRGGINQ